MGVRLALAVALAVTACEQEACFTEPPSPPLGDGEELYIYSEGGWGHQRTPASALWMAPVAIGEGVLVVERRESPCAGDRRRQRRLAPGPPEDMTVELEPSSLARVDSVEATPDGLLRVTYEALAEGDGTVAVSGPFGGVWQGDRRRFSVRSFADVGLGVPGLADVGRSPVVEGGVWPVEPWPTSSSGEAIVLPEPPDLPWRRADDALELVSFGPTNGVEHAVRWLLPGAVPARLGRFEKDTPVAATTVEVVRSDHVVSGAVEEMSTPRRLDAAQGALTCRRGDSVALLVHLVDDQGRNLSGGAALVESSDPEVVRVSAGLTGTAVLVCAAPGQAAVSLPIPTVPFHATVTVM